MRFERASGPGEKSPSREKILYATNPVGPHGHVLKYQWDQEMMQLLPDRLSVLSSATEEVVRKAKEDARLAWRRKAGGAGGRTPAFRANCAVRTARAFASASSSLCHDQKE